MNPSTSDPLAPPRPADGPADVDTGQRSVLDEVRRIRAEREAADPARLVLDVRGYEGRLAIIYRYPPEGVERVLAGTEKRMSADTALEKVEGAADVIVACCGAVVARDENKRLVDLLTGEPIPEKGLPESPIRLDKRFGELLGIEIPPEVKGVNRHVARHVFSPRAMKTGEYDGDFALIAQANILIGWLNGVITEVDEDALGE